MPKSIIFYRGAAHHTLPAEVQVQLRIADTLRGMPQQMMLLLEQPITNLRTLLNAFLARLCACGHAIMLPQPPLIVPYRVLQLPQWQVNAFQLSLITVQAMLCAFQTALFGLQAVLSVSQAPLVAQVRRISYKSQSITN